MSLMLHKPGHPQVAPTNLGSFDTAFCDSLEALQQAGCAGLSPSAEIRTTAPALLLNAAAFRVIPSLPDAQRLGTYFTELPRLSKALHDAAVTAGMEDLKIVAARVGLQFHRVATKALGLTSADFTQPRLVIGVQTGNEKVDRTLNAPWERLLATNPRLARVTFQVRGGRHLPGTPPLSYRLRLVDVGAVGFALLTRLHRHFGRFLKRQALLVGSNELLREASFHLARHGYAIESVAMPLLRTPEQPELVAAQKAAMACRSAVTDFLDRWFVPEFRAAALPLFEAMFHEAVCRYYGAVRAWSLRLSAVRRGDNAVVLANITGDPSYIGLMRACQTYGLPLVAFQHAVSREICADHDFMAAIYENAASDLFLSFNPEAVRASRGIPFQRARCEAVGLPKIFYAVRRSLRRNRRCPILYVSTALQSGNVNVLMGSATDADRTKHEIAITDAVLSRLPHRVLYKTYPGRDRYADPDPAVERARAHSNIDLFEQQIDMRYFVGNHDVVVSARATSTASWCLMADRPFVFLNMHDNSPLNAAAHARFRDGVFLFDWSDTDVLAQLREFLSQPLSAIRAEWDRKRPARDELIREFIAGPGPGAGRRAANVVISFFDEWLHARKGA